MSRLWVRVPPDPPMEFETFEKLITELGFIPCSHKDYNLYKKDNTSVRFFNDLSNGQVIVIYTFDYSIEFPHIKDFKKIVHYQKQDEVVIKELKTILDV